ncbi:MAG: YhcU family protein [Bacillus sp. (in: firmicutes)]|uniref:YhcU family protein n=1 Tax=Bacillus sp. SORGH_AS_0510 TaxID=3041771 RepID=UPI002785F84B|nr:YhcU family protein [Bacillus sp. SORGH_AS_0510]MDQ1147267.1 hypothetical protein [Bacillus sp. SORGH_AS_0510]
MKIVFASTPSQEEEINELVRYIYSNIFPLYFSDEEIYQFEQLGILRPTEDFSTLKDAFQVMTCIRTLISILESTQLDRHYAGLYKKNVDTLEYYGLSFPFDFEQFVSVGSIKHSMLSIYTRADNELLI